MKNNKPPIWEWFTQPFYGDLEDGLLLFYQHLLENHGKLMGFNGDLIGFHEILMGN